MNHVNVDDIQMAILLKKTLPGSPEWLAMTELQRLRDRDRQTCKYSVTGEGSPASPRGYLTTQCGVRMYAFDIRDHNKQPVKIMFCPFPGCGKRVEIWDERLQRNVE